MEDRENASPHNTPVAAIHIEVWPENVFLPRLKTTFPYLTPAKGPRPDILKELTTAPLQGSPLLHKIVMRNLALFQAALFYLKEKNLVHKTITLMDHKQRTCWDILLAIHKKEGFVTVLGNAFGEFARLVASHLICPLSNTFLNYPAVADDGNTYHQFHANHQKDDFTFAHTTNLFAQQFIEYLFKGEFKNINFDCLIMYETMKLPIITSDTQTYERSNIVDKKNSPMNPNHQLTHKNIINNFMLRLMSTILQSKSRDEIICQFQAALQENKGGLLSQEDFEFIKMKLNSEQDEQSDLYPFLENLATSASDSKMIAWLLAYFKEIDRPDLMLFLLDKGPTITPMPQVLYWAIEKKYKTLAEILIKHNVSVEPLYESKISIFDKIIENQWRDIVSILLRKNTYTDTTLENAILTATNNTKTRDIAKCLLAVKRKIDVNRACLPVTWHSTLQCAIINRDDELVRILCEHGATANGKKNKKGDTAFTMAYTQTFLPDEQIDSKSLRVLKTLLRYASDITNYQRTELFFTAKKYGIEETFHVDNHLAFFKEAPAEEEEGTFYSPTPSAPPKSSFPF